MIAREARLFLIALQFLTRLPLRLVQDFPADWLARSAKYMPLVGALIGAGAGASLLASTLIFPEPLPVVVGLAVAIVLTGALHEDGLADTVDALGSGADQERSLEIMKDSRIGVFGTIALIVTLATKAAALLPMDPASAAAALIAGHAGARLAAVLTLVSLDHASPDAAKVSRPITSLTPEEIATAVALGLIPGLIVLPASILMISAALAFGAAALIAFASLRRIGGYTGDILGAVEQVYEVTFLVCAATAIAGPG